MLDDMDRAIINRLQEGFPIASSPFRAVAAELGLTEADLVARLKRLREDRVITRFGPFFDAVEMGGAFCLCAMAVPEEAFDAAVEAVNAFPEVAHNYKRTHHLNMWFVLGTETPEGPKGIEATAKRIEEAAGYPVLLFPKLQEFFVGFKVAA